MSKPDLTHETKNGPSNLKVVLWIIFFFPVGLWKMWKYERFSLRARQVTTGALGIMLFYHLSQTGSYSDHAKSQPPMTVASELAKTKKAYQIDRLSREIQTRLQEGKNPFDYAVTVTHMEFQGHDVLSCNVNNGKGACGLFEVIEKDGDYRAYWVNGAAKEKLGSVMERTPSSIDISAAHKAVTKQ